MEETGQFIARMDKKLLEDFEKALAVAKERYEREHNKKLFKNAIVKEWIESFIEKEINNANT